MKFCLCVSLLAAAIGSGENWPAFRGYGNSLTTATDLPVTWSETENVHWQVKLAGYGQSSPVIWGDLVVVTSTSGEHKENLIVQAYSLKTGEKLWERKETTEFTVPEVSNYISQSAPTPVVDEDRIYAFFESGEVIALNHQGEVKWNRSLQKEYGEFQGNHGLGSSMAITQDSVVLLVDHSGPSYLLALNKQNGENLWKNDRPKRVSWSSPVVRGEAGKEQLVVSSNGVVQVFAAADGKQLWEKTELKGNTVPSPTVVEDKVLIGTSRKGNNLLLQATNSGAMEVVWENKKITSSFSSPLIHQGCVYYINKAGVAICLDLQSGEEIWKERLADSCWASPVGAGDHIYFFTKAGTTQVINAKAEALEVIATNELPTEDKVYGVAAVNGHFVVRTGEKLYCLKSDQ